MKSYAPLLSSLLVVAIAVPIPAVVSAADDTLSLRDAVRLAIAASPEAAIAAAEVEVAEADEQLAGGQRGPRVEVTADYTLTTNPVLVFGNLLRQRNFTEANFALDALNRPDPLGNWNATASLSQPVYTGGSLSARQEAARLEIAARTAESLRARQQVRFAALTAYGDAVMARHQLDATRQVVATAQAHEAMVQDLADAGLVVDADLMQARLRTAEAREAEVRASGAVRVSQAALNLLIGRSPDAPIVLPRADALTADLAASPAIERAVSEALSDRPDLEAARQRTLASNEGIAAARGMRLPQVGIWGAFETNAQDFFGADGTNWTVMARARWSVFDGSRAASEIARAEIRSRQAESAVQLLERNIRLAVYSAHNELETARERLIQTEISIDLARTSLATVEDRYREGMVTLVELLDAQTSLTRALAREVAVRRDVVVAAAGLQLATGEPLAPDITIDIPSKLPESSR